jgi:RNA polymerase sigma factor (sigma-70 family)
MKGLTAKDTVESLYSEYAEKIYNLSFQMTGDEELSKDILHETFIKVIENIDKFRYESTYFTWIYTIAKNICFAKLNQRNKKSLVDIEKLIDKAGAEPENETYNEIEKRFYINQVKDGCLLGVLRCLSLSQRIAFILNLVLDVSVKDISIIIDKSENATRILIHRSKKTIRSFLCRNCSLYGQSEKCKCENLISFSLSQDWIEKYNPSIHPRNIEEEIKQLKDKLFMYRTVLSNDFDKNLACFMKKFVNESDFSIFLEKKVK